MRSKTPSVQRAKRDSFEDQHVQRALQQVNLFVHVSPCASRRDTTRTPLAGQGESILVGQPLANKEASNDRFKESRLE
jgi:hypothetical protein